MSADASAYAALGLEPGADPAAVDEAYKRLIKLYHPDREGGDGTRAAEIIHAYRELRAAFAARNALVLVEDEPFGGRRASRWVGPAVMLALAVGTLLLITGPGAAYLSQALEPPAPRRHAASAAAGADSMDGPLEASAVDGAIRDALQIVRSQDEMALASASRECHDTLRDEPSIAQLDRCAAFDNAVVQLQDRDPLRDRGPFSEIAVTRRQWSAAKTISNDYLAIDSRLDRIRLRVELALVPAEPPPVTTAEAD